MVTPDFEANSLKLNVIGNNLALVGDKTIWIITIPESIRVNKAESVTCRFIPLNTEDKIIQAEWHPFSDVHLIILTQDKSLKSKLLIFNLSRDNMEPEQKFDLDSKNRVVSFSFGRQSDQGRFTIFYLCDSGHLVSLYPIIPLHISLPKEFLTCFDIHQVTTFKRSQWPTETNYRISKLGIFTQLINIPSSKHFTSLAAVTQKGNVFIMVVIDEEKSLTVLEELEMNDHSSLYTGFLKNHLFVVGQDIIHHVHTLPFEEMDQYLAKDSTVSLSDKTQSTVDIVYAKDGVVGVGLHYEKLNLLILDKDDHLNSVSFLTAKIQSNFTSSVPKPVEFLSTIETLLEKFNKNVKRMPVIENPKEIPEKYVDLISKLRNENLFVLDSCMSHLENRIEVLKQLSEEQPRKNQELEEKLFKIEKNNVSYEREYKQMMEKQIKLNERFNRFLKKTSFLSEAESNAAERLEETDRLLHNWKIKVSDMKQERIQVKTKTNTNVDQLKCMMKTMTETLQVMEKSKIKINDMKQHFE